MIYSYLIRLQCGAGTSASPIENYRITLVEDLNDHPTPPLVRIGLEQLHLDQIGNPSWRPIDKEDRFTRETLLFALLSHFQHGGKRSNGHSDMPLGLLKFDDDTEMFRFVEGA